MFLCACPCFYFCLFFVCSHRFYLFSRAREVRVDVAWVFLLLLRVVLVCVCVLKTLKAGRSTFSLRAAIIMKLCFEDKYRIQAEWCGQVFVWFLFISVYIRKPRYLAKSYVFLVFLLCTYDASTLLLYIHTIAHSLTHSPHCQGGISAAPYPHIWWGQGKISELEATYLWGF